MGTWPQSSSRHTLLLNMCGKLVKRRKTDRILFWWKWWLDGSCPAPRSSGSMNRVSWSSVRWLVVSDRSAFCRVCTTEDGSDDFMMLGTVSDWQAPKLDWLVFLFVNVQYSLKKTFNLSELGLVFFFKGYIYLFGCASGLSCDTWDLHFLSQPVGSLVEA